MILADELPLSRIDPGQAVTIVICFGVLLVVVNVVGVIMGFVILSRRRPSIEAEFATKREMADGFSRVDTDIKRLDGRNEEIATKIFAKIDNLTVSVNTVFQRFERDLGRLEKK